MNYLLYQAYGEKENLHVMLYSLMTFLYVSSEETKNNTHIVIYTDGYEHLSSFLSDLPNVIYEITSPSKFKEWKGDINFVHRIKIKMIEHFFSKYTGKVLYVDTDTVFMKDPSPIFKNISDFDVYMHVCEGSIGSRVNRVMKKTERFVKKHNFQLSVGEVMHIPLTTNIWNAGVLGLTNAQQVILKDVIELTEGIYKLWDMNGAEQLSFSYFLQNKFKINPAEGIIHHYWYFKEFYKIADDFFIHHQGKSLLSILHLTPNIDPIRLQKPKVAYRKLNPIMRSIKRRMGDPWTMPEYSFN